MVGSRTIEAGTRLEFEEENEAQIIVGNAHILGAGQITSHSNQNLLQETDNNDMRIFAAKNSPNVSPTL